MSIRGYFVQEVDGKEIVNITHMNPRLYQWLWENYKLYMHKSESFTQDGAVGLLALSAVDVQFIKEKFSVEEIGDFLEGIDRVMEDHPGSCVWGDERAPIISTYYFVCY